MSAHRFALSRRYRATLRAYVDTPCMHHYQRPIVDNYCTNAMKLTIPSAVRCALEKNGEKHFVSRGIPVPKRTRRCYRCRKLNRMLR